MCPRRTRRRTCNILSFCSVRTSHPGCVLCPVAGVRPGFLRTMAGGYLQFGVRGENFVVFFVCFGFFFFKSANELSQRAGSRETAFAGKHPRMPQIFARVRTGRRKLRFKPQLPAKMDCKYTKSVHLKFNERFAARTSHGTNTFCRPPSQLWPPNQSPARDACSWPVTQEGKASGPSTLGLRRRHRGTRKPGRAGRPPPPRRARPPPAGGPSPCPAPARLQGASSTSALRGTDRQALPRPVSSTPALTREKYRFGRLRWK